MKRCLGGLGWVVAVAIVLTSARAHAADPTTVDCLAANEGAIALRGKHELRGARAQSLVCAAATCPTDIRTECTRRVAELNAAIPTIVFEVKDSSGSDVSAVQVTMDGKPLVDRLEGTALSIDPGEHAFGFAASGQPVVEKRFVIREGEKDRRERIALGAMASAPVTAAPPLATAGPLTQGTPSASGAPGAETSHGLGTQKILGLVAMGAGVVGVGLGTVFGLQSMSKHDDAQKACPNTQCTTQDGVALWNDARSAGDLSTIFFAVGGVGLAGGAVLWFTAKSESADAPSAQVGLGPGTIQLRGAW
ncbi:MAG TPA: hypothetical protein VGY54_17520 [Polyangiaceae bacterium]|jgi:hypothetical protein|nr:hypothetical protein [Polyangiaceae bacterium]